MIKIKNIPNVLTGVRILLSAVLLFLQPLSALFFIIYVISGASDVLDGYLARRTKSTSSFGATLDSIADLIFITIILVILIPMIHVPAWALIWMIGIIIVRLSSLLVGYVRYRSFAFLHTYANKAAGLALFCFPFLYSIVGLTITVVAVCSLSSVSAIEELGINLTAKELSRDRKSIFIK